MSIRGFVVLLAFAVVVSVTAPAAQRGSGNTRRTEAALEVITRTIVETERDTDKFVRSLRAALNFTALNRTNREDDLNRSARQLERAMDRVRENWTKGKDVSRTKRYVSDAIREARNINTTMRARRLSSGVERDWEDVRRQLNLLARAFDLPSIRW